MKRVYISALVLLGMLAASGMAASTASARCAMSTQDVGNFLDKSDSGDCLNEDILRTRLWIVVDGIEHPIGEGIYCAEASGTAKGYSSDTCTGEEHEGSGVWVKVDPPGCGEGVEGGKAFHEPSTASDPGQETQPLTANIFAQMPQLLADLNLTDLPVMTRAQEQAQAIVPS